NSGSCINRKPASPLTYEWCTRRGKVTPAITLAQRVEGPVDGLEGFRPDLSIAGHFRQTSLIVGHCWAIYGWSTRISAAEMQKPPPFGRGFLA
ncbi:hypothetical protein, partial [Burkholderia contaminans]|uniref:hypothetical protein n=1 Tax=Burkholderia contaminans TaxID=488447 RepID=UPI001C89493E